MSNVSNVGEKQSANGMLSILKTLPIVIGIVTLIFSVAAAYTTTRIQVGTLAQRFDGFEKKLDIVIEKVNNMTPTVLSSKEWVDFFRDEFSKLKAENDRLKDEIRGRR